MAFFSSFFSLSLRFTEYTFVFLYVCVAGKCKASFPLAKSALQPQNLFARHKISKYFLGGGGGGILCVQGKMSIELLFVEGLNIQSI